MCSIFNSGSIDNEFKRISFSKVETLKVFNSKRLSFSNEFKGTWKK